MQTLANPADETKVIIQNGQRVTGPLSEAEAKTEVERRNKIAESTGKPVPENQRARIKTNLMG